MATDSSACVWDAEVGARIRKLKGHKEYVNSVAASRNDGNLFVTGGDDCTIKVWDARRRGHVHSLVSKFQVTAVSFGHDADEVISGGLDNVVKVRIRRNGGTVACPDPPCPDPPLPRFGISESRTSSTG